MTITISRINRVLFSSAILAAFTSPAFAQCVVGATPTTAPITGQTVTCSGTSTAPVNAVTGSTGVTINIGSALDGTAIVHASHSAPNPLVLVSVEKASTIANYGTLAVSGVGASSARGVAMLGVGDLNPDLTVTNTLYNFGTISTTGAYNTGMGASGGGNVLYNELDGIITTTGSYAYGISSGWNASGGTEGPTFNTLTNDGFVQVSGSNSRAGSIVGSDSTLNNSDTGTLLATGNGSVGVYLNGTRDELNNDGLIQSTGNNLAASNAYAVNVNMVGSSLTAIINNSASGKIISANANAINLSGGTATIENGGLIETDSPTGAAIAGNSLSSLNLSLRVTSQIIGKVEGGGGDNTLTLLAYNSAFDGATTVGSATNAFTDFDTLTVNADAAWNWNGSGMFTTVTIQNGAALALQTIGAQTGSLALGAGGTFTIDNGGTLALGALTGVNPAGGTSPDDDITAGNLTGDLINNGTVLFNHTNGTRNVADPNYVAPLAFNNVISGAGKVVVQNGVTTLGASNGYSGGTYLNGGVLQVNNDNNLGTGALNFNGGTLNTTANVTFANTRAITLIADDIGADGGTFDTNTGTTLTVDSNISGSGGLTKNGAGTLTLTNGNSYSGGTTLNAGTLNTNVPTALGSGALTVNTGGTLNLSGALIAGSLSGTGGNISGFGIFFVNQTTDATWAGTFNNLNGNLGKDGDGTLTLTNTAYATAPSVVNGNVDVAGGALAFEQNGVFTVNGDYNASADATTVIGPNATLNVGVNSNIAGSTLNVTIGAANSPAVNVGVNAIITGAKLSISGYNGTSFRVIQTTGGNVIGTFANTYIGGATATTADYLSVQTAYSAKAVDVTLGLSWLDTAANNHGTFTLTNATDSFDVGVALDNRTSNGTNALRPGWDGKTLTKNGAGMLILSADNTYTGNTVINGGTLQIGNGGATGSIASTSEVHMDNNSTLAFNRDSTSDLIVGSLITGVGSVEQIGSGKTILTNANDYSDGTSVLNGILQLGVDGGAAGSITGAVTVDGGGSGSLLRIENSDTSGISTIVNSNRGITQFANSQSADDIGITNSNFGITLFSGSSSADNATINNNSNGLTFFDDASKATIGTHINNNGGVTFFGTNPFNLLASGTPGSTATAGSATITNSNGGGVYFTAESDAGNATITNNSGGLTQFVTDSTAATAKITNNTGGRTDFFGNSTADSATITNQSGGETDFFGNSRGGNASITNEGGRTYFVGNADPVNAALKNDGAGSTFDFSGTTGALSNNKISAGSIEGDGRFLLGNNELTVGSNGLDTSVSGIISDGGYNGGTGGSLVKIGTGTLTLTLTGINTYSGGTTINDGKIIGTAASFGSGAIANNAAIEIAQTTDAAFANTLSGGGALTKSGAGTLYYLGDGSGFNGLTTVAAGALMVLNGDDTLTTLDSDITVESGATMGGDGTIGGLYAKGGSTIVPGNGIGTLTVNRTVTFESGSIFEVELNPAHGDLLHSTGTTTINGGSVNVLAGSGNYAANTDYTIITADAGSNGVFDGGVTTNLAYLTPTLLYPDAYSVVLRMTRIGSFGEGGTPNQRATGAGAESVGGGVIYDAITNLTAPQALVAFDALSGEIHASAQSALIEDSRFLREVTADRMREAQSHITSKAPVRVALVAGWPDLAPEPGHVFWSHAFGSWGKMDGDGNAASLNRDIGGLLIGADTAIAENARIGFVGGYSYSDFNVGNGRRSSGNSDNYTLGIYGGAKWASLALRTGAAYTWHNLETRRHVNIGAFSDRLKADYDADTTQAYAELGYGIASGDTTFEPFANLAYVNVNTDSFREKGGVAALRVKGSDTDMVFSTLGLHLSGIAFDKASFRGTLGWRHAFGDKTPESTMNFLTGGNAFSIAGAPIARNSAVLDAGLDFAISENAMLGVSYNGQFGSDITDNGVRVNFSWKF